MSFSAAITLGFRFNVWFQEEEETSHVTKKKKPMSDPCQVVARLCGA